MTKIVSRHLAFAPTIIGAVVLYWKDLAALVSLSLHDDSSSYILVIPIVALYLFYTERRVIFEEVENSITPGFCLILTGIGLTALADPHFYSHNAEHLSASVLGFAFVVIGAFFACYGRKAIRAAEFPLLFLLLIVPFPAPVLSRAIAALQQGSVEISFALFKMCGVPVLRQGFLLSVPGVTIEVAQECSSIRSSMALLITCILASRFYLRSFWKQAFFVLVSLPLSVIKNGIRIATLTLLSIYVDPGFLYGSLHRDGGFLFFLIALAMLWPLLIALHRSESWPTLKSNEIQQSRQFVRG